MTAALRSNIAAFVAGVLFAVGLALAGMTQPSKVVAFLDFFGDWDPSLAFVMGGAIAMHASLYRFVIRRPSPLFVERFHVPTRRDVTGSLVVGSGLFGVGWGLGGFCPGPGITALPTLGVHAVVFVGTMGLGMLLHRAYQRTLARDPAGSNQSRSAA